MIRKLRAKFIFVTMCVVLAVLVAMAGTLNIATYKRVDDDTDDILAVLVDNGGIMPLPEYVNGPTPIMPSLPPETPYQTRYFTVTIKDGDFVKINMTSIHKLSEEQVIAYTNEVIASGQTEGYFGDYKIAKISTTSGEMYIFLDCSQYLYTARHLTKISILVAVGALALIFGLVCFFSYIVVRPIEESYLKQKRFITDANHELKTPLAVIKATNEVVELTFGENEWTVSINNQVKKLTDLTEKLVFLSRMDEEKAEMPMIEFDLSQTTKEIAESFEYVSKASNKTYNINILPNLNMVGDVSLISQLISVLLENAFKYSNENGRIDITLSGTNKTKKLIVGNTTTGIDKKNLDRLFDRFYRTDKSRNSETGGHGIGLSIAKSIVNIHKGKIFAKSDDGKYIEFVVIL